MIKLTLLLFYLQIFFSTFSQENLVPNGNFDANPGNYGGGTNPVVYYTQGSDCVKGRKKFEEEITNWKVAESNATVSELNALIIIKHNLMFDNFQEEYIH